MRELGYLYFNFYELVREDCCWGILILYKVKFSFKGLEYFEVIGVKGWDLRVFVISID